MDDFSLIHGMLLDRARTRDMEYRLTHTHFLTPAQRADAEQIARTEHLYPGCFFYGGYLDAERTVCILGGRCRGAGYIFPAGSGGLPALRDPSAQGRIQHTDAPGLSGRAAGSGRQAGNDRRPAGIRRWLRYPCTASDCALSGRALHLRRARDAALYSGGNQHPENSRAGWERNFYQCKVSAG